MQEVHAYVTKTTSNSRRLFLCTINPCDIHMGCAWQENFLMRNIGSTDMELYPLTLYRLRWNIEVGYYEQKTFWSLGKYMVRSKHSIETLLNLINVAYAAMRIYFLLYHTCPPPARLLYVLTRIFLLLAVGGRLSLLLSLLFINQDITICFQPCHVKKCANFILPFPAFIKKHKKIPVSSTSIFLYINY